MCIRDRNGSKVVDDSPSDKLLIAKLFDIKSIATKMNHKITQIGKINHGYKKNLIKLDNKSLNLTDFKGYSHKF